MDEIILQYIDENSLGDCVYIAGWVEDPQQRERLVSNAHQILGRFDVKRVAREHEEMHRGLIDRHERQNDNDQQASKQASKQASVRVAWLDVLKGIGIILVVIGHVYHNKIIFNWIYSFHMPLFFYAAGCVYREKPILTDIRRRVQTIVVPYFSFGVLVLIYWQVIERRFRDSSMSFTASLLGLISGEYDYLEFNVHLWFLPCFFVTVVLFNALVRLGMRFHMGYAVAYVVAVVMSLVYVYCSLPAMPWGFDRTFQYIAFYALGVCTVDIMNTETARGINKSMPLLVSVPLLAINYLLAFHCLTSGYMWYVTAIVGIIAIVILSMAIRHNRVFEYLGRITLVILCIHGPVYRIIVKLVSIPANMSTDAVRENIVLAAVVVTITLTVCAMANETIDRFIPWMLGKKTV